MSNLRFEAVSEASKRKPVEVTAPSERPSEFFGKKVFNRQKMYKYLPAADLVTADSYSLSGYVLTHVLWCHLPAL